MATAHRPAAPTPTSVPPVDDGFWKESTWAILFALIDAAVPPVVPESALTDKRSQLRISQRQYEEAYDHVCRTTTHPPELDKFKEYLRARPADNPRFVLSIKRVFSNLPDDAKKKLGGALDLMGTRFGSWIFSGYCTPIQDLPLHIREAVLRSWSASRIPAFRRIAKVVTDLARTTFAKTDHLWHQLINYTDYPEDYSPAPGFDFDFIQFSAGDSPEVIETDIIIIGSGCGGAVSAKVLAEAGQQVLVVDKGYYFPPSQLPMDQDTGLTSLFENEGLISSDDNSIAAVAGSCWGGGGTVNWAASLQPQDFVRREWASEGLSFFETAEFQQSLDRVCEFMGVNTDKTRHNSANQKLLDGARKLGWSAKVSPQNSGGVEHYCGQCHLGCGSAGKKGPAVSWLPAASKAGAKFVEGFEATEILFDETSESKKAIGVVGKWTSRDKDGGVGTVEADRTHRAVHIKAKKVIVSGGGLHSPLILMRSGLENPHIGKNLHVHPANYVKARFDEDVMPWKGSCITSICDLFENLDGKGHGVKLETMNMVPYMNLGSFTWNGGLDFKLDALKYRNVAAYFSMARDRDTGKVYPDPVSGRPRIDYTPSDFDRAHNLTGVIALAKVCYIEGAEEIWVSYPGTEPFVSSTAANLETGKAERDVNDPAFASWLASVEKVGNKSEFIRFGSAHIMGSCRMSSSEADGVVDAQGKVWGTENLYVADTSVFPSATGVNPMITAMGIADWIARGIVRELAP